MGDQLIPDAGAAGTCPTDTLPWMDRTPPPHHRAQDGAQPDAQPGNETITAPPSIGLVFKNPGVLHHGDMLQGDRHRGLFLEPLDSDLAVTMFLLQVAANAQYGGTRLCIKVPVTHNVSVAFLQQLRVRWRSGQSFYPNSAICCEAFAPVEDHPLIAGVAYFGSVERDRRPFVETVLGEHELWRTAMAQCYPVDVDTNKVEVLENPSEDDIERIIGIYDRSFDKYLCDLSDREAVREMVTSSLTVVIREQGQIVAIAIAEHICLEFDGHPGINFVEISDVAVSPEARVGGHAKAMYQRLVEICDLRYGVGEESLVITTEIRAICAPLHRIMRRCGFEAVGFMPSHCEIQHDDTAAFGLQQNNGYGDLLVCVWDRDGFVDPNEQEHWWEAYE